jgi:antitoxin ParD1/3/4
LTKIGNQPILDSVTEDRMTTMNVSLPTSLRAFVEDLVKAEGYSSASEYVRELIRGARRSLRKRDQIEHLLLEGLASGEPAPFEEDYFDKLRQRIRRERDKRAQT